MPVTPTMSKRSSVAQSISSTFSSISTISCAPASAATVGSAPLIIVLRRSPG